MSSLHLQASFPSRPDTGARFAVPTFIVMAAACVFASGWTNIGRAADDAPAAHLSLDELIDGLGRQSQKFLETESFFVDYAFVSSEDFVRSKYGKREAGFHFRLGRRGDMWYAWIEGSDAPLRQKADQTLVFRDGVASELRTHREGNHLMIKDWPSSNIYQWWQYTDNLGFDIYQYLPPTAVKLPQIDQPFLPAAIAENRDAYTVAADLEEVDGAWCHLIERPNVDRIWVDAELGFAVRKRELYFPDDRPQQTLQKIIHNRDHSEVLPGLWLPQTQVVDYYPDPKFEDPGVWGQLTNRLTMKVDKMEFNSLDDEFFKLDVPPNTSVVDQIRDLQYNAQSAEDVPFGPALRFARPRTAPVRSNTVWILLVNGLIMGVVIVIVLWRRTHQVRDKHTRMESKA